MPLYLTNKAFEHPFIARDQLQPGQQNQLKPQLPDHSVHLLATSLESELPAAGLEAWLNTPEMTWTEALRVLTPGGRMCVTVANPGPKVYVPLHALVTSQCQELDLLIRGEIILQLQHEETSVGHRYILVWSKEGYRRARTMGWSSTISGPGFIRATKSIRPQATTIDAHRRTIELYTYGGEVACHPYTGKGDTAQATMAAGQRFRGCRCNPQVQEFLDSAAAR